TLSTRPTILRYLFNEGMKDKNKGENEKILKRVNLVRRLVTYMMEYEIEFKVEIYRRKLFEDKEEETGRPSWNQSERERVFGKGIRSPNDLLAGIFKQEDFDDLFRYSDRDPLEVIIEAASGLPGINPEATDHLQKLEGIVKYMEKIMVDAEEKRPGQRTNWLPRNRAQEDAYRYFAYYGPMLERKRKELEEKKIQLDRATEDDSERTALEEKIKELESHITDLEHWKGLSLEEKIAEYKKIKEKKENGETLTAYEEAFNNSAALSAYLQIIANNLKEKVNDLVYKKELYLTRFKIGWAAFIKDTLRPYIYVLSLPVYRYSANS
ncbi:MAG: hypothetical protein KKB22_00060, partial [Candidatus Omnitrophica bacterium]|nr:hypothetical protein [Candidatus Omnitrophota bacterium]